MKLREFLKRKALEGEWSRAELERQRREWSQDELEHYQDRIYARGYLDAVEDMEELKKCQSSNA